MIVATSRRMGSVGGRKSRLKKNIECFLLHRPHDGEESHVLFATGQKLLYHNKPRVKTEIYPRL